MYAEAPAAVERAYVPGSFWVKLVLEVELETDTADDVPAAPRRQLQTNALTGTIPAQLSTLTSNAR
eukprot:CAMPEP_0182907160 /NCGR_PEP_ID=MMETSP0034_2-20130328/34289_1 /TAXON_ID=156128 /ORGANISM="Nephroselmis pyriformis, Strain CCMP717" /LENGTH=65 /DNA_ID=CAMNT_0025043039 /DNA_START=117 /DNA_END=312 /DNA_ORIENTATION=+